MVDAIGPKTVSTADRLADRIVASTTLASTGSVATVANAASKPGEATRQQLELSAIAFDFGKDAPIDSKHVEDVRRAVRNGTYPLTPDTIADRMLALKLNWSPKK